MTIEKAKAILKSKKLDAIILFSQSPSFRYLLGEILESGIVLITKTRAYVLVNELSNPKIAGFKTIVFGRNFEDVWKSLLKKHSVKKAGIDGFNILQRQHKFISKKLKLIDINEKLEQMRVVKTKEEMAKIRKACQITDEVFSLIIKNFKQFKTEKDIDRFIRLEFMKRGAECAYDPCVQSGKNAGVPHNKPKNEMNKGFMVLDIGAKYEGYCSDMTRTIYLGKPTQEEFDIYQKVLWIADECISKARAGMKGSELHNLSVELLGKDARYYTHAIGHGFGIEIHENPRMYPKSEDVLMKGTVITIEPGYYNTKLGIGIRIEDDIYLGKKKEILNKSKRELIVINK